MRNLCIVCIFLLFITQADAGMKLSVNGQVAPDTLFLWTSEVITLDIIVEAGTWFSGGSIGIKLSNNQGSIGSLDATGITYETEPMTRYYFGNPYYMWYDGNKAWDAPWSVYDSSSTEVKMTGGNNFSPSSGNTMGEYVLADGIVFHLEEANYGGEVIIDLVALSDLGYGIGDPSAQPPEWEFVPIYPEGAIIDSIHVPEIPEPATFVLLGLGAMALRRRLKG